MKIDVFAHILPPKYKEALSQHVEANPRPGWSPLTSIIEPDPTLFDMEHRFRIMDKYPDVVQVLTISVAPVEAIAEPKEAAELARLANNEMAELVRKYPDRFVAAVASLPMNDMDAALKEADRAINELKFRGVLIWTPVNRKPMDSPEFMRLYEKMAHYNLPIFIHPQRALTLPDYAGEKRSKYRMYALWGWPYETTLAMTRLVISGVLEKYPKVKFLTHHGGGMVPYFEQRVVGFYDHAEMRLNRSHKQGLSKAPIDDFKMFYNDTALYGGTAALMCAYAFFGADHLLFGTDTPYDSQDGERCIRETIRSVAEMDIPALDKKTIFEDNAKELLRLPL